MNADDPSNWLPFKRWRSVANPKAVIETFCTSYILNPGHGGGIVGKADDLDTAKRYASRFHRIPFDSWYEEEMPS